MSTLGKWTVKQQALIDNYEKAGFDLVKAGLLAGYSKTFAKTRLKFIVKKNVELCRELNKQTAKTKATQRNRVERNMQRLDSIINDEHETKANVIKCIDIQMKCAGVYSETRRIETKERQQALSDAEAQAAKQLSKAVLALPCPAPPLNIVGAVIPQVTRTEPKEAEFEGNSQETGAKQHGNNDDNEQPEQQ